jgi:tryptophan synthase alpha chain
MNRYQTTFRRLAKNGETAFVPFTVIGDPDVRTSLAIVKTFVGAGADVLELGMPFSDPIADGPVIQKAGMRALSAGMTPKKMFRFIRRVRTMTEAPIGLLCYYNTVLRTGIPAFFRECRKNGVDSVLVADASVEEAGALISASRASRVKNVFILSELSDERRIKKIARRSGAFIYLVSRLGVTGARQSLNPSIAGFIRNVKRATRVPVCVGFGISKPAHVRMLKKAGVEGVICGSAIVGRVEKHLGAPKAMCRDIHAFVRTMKGATR